MEEHEQDGPVSREQAAATGEDPPGDEDVEAEESSDEGTDNPLLDTEQHSDAPGPFGTG